MLNTTISTLEIKTTGTDLSTVETMYITIKQGSFQTVKSNDDIEVDNDIILLSLTQSEVSQFAEMTGISISILAMRHDGETFNVKIVWVKRGSRTSHAAGGGSDGGVTVSNEVWLPTVSADGIITWVKSTSETPPAPRNIKGAKGDNGVTPHIDSSTGNWFIGTVNTGVKARGTDGVTPSIGANGNWYIGSNDTGVKARGTDGKDGTDGEDGFSPEITENSGNNDSTYKLDITTKSGSFTTPNLKGKDGTGGGASGDYLPLTGGTLKREQQGVNVLTLTSTYSKNAVGMDIKSLDGASFARIQTSLNSLDEASFRVYDIVPNGKATNLFSVSKAGERHLYVGEAQSMKKIVTEYEVPFRFGIDELGNYGYYKGESFIPFGQGGSGSGSSISNVDFDKFDIITKTVFIDMLPVGGDERVSVIDRS